MHAETLDSARDAEVWRRTLGRFPTGMQDVYFSAEYVGLHRIEPGARALLFSCESGGRAWVYAFLLQPIKPIGERGLEGPWFDIETAYGYGGPVANTDDGVFLAEAHEAFREWCREQGVVAEFVRLHPLLRNERWLDPAVEVAHDRQTVSLNLADFDMTHLPFDSGTRYMLRRAERLGIKVHAQAAGEGSFARFRTLYDRTMDRLLADDYYRFGDDYFAGLCDLVADSGLLLAAEQAGEWAAAAVFLKGPTWLHYHLSASDPDKRLPGAINLLLCAAAERGRKEGLTRLHLGGGRTRSSEDSLLAFKRCMGTDSHSFYVGKRIHNAGAYVYIRELWEQSYPSLVPNYGQRLLCYHHRLVGQ